MAWQRCGSGSGDGKIGNVENTKTWSQFNGAVIKPLKTSLPKVLDYDCAECFFVFVFVLNPVNVAVTTATDILVTVILYNTSPPLPPRVTCSALALAAAETD